MHSDWDVTRKTGGSPIACLKNHSYHLHAPLCVIFAPNSGYIARYAPFIWHKSPTNCDAHLAESIFQTRSRAYCRDRREYSGWTNMTGYASKWRSRRRIKIAIRNESTSAAGCAYSTPLSPLRCGSSKITGIKQIPCLHAPRKNPNRALPSARNSDEYTV